uniref:Uncharacterized protein n=1 Tax=Ixodes ricinus TaxID=34613 RepID=A0A6B0UHI5_IXORI
MFTGVALAHIRKTMAARFCIFLLFLIHIPFELSSRRKGRPLLLATTETRLPRFLRCVGECCDKRPRYISTCIHTIFNLYGLPPCAPSLMLYVLALVTYLPYT